MDKEIYDVVKEEADETGEWVSLVEIIGGYGINPFDCTDDEIKTIANNIKNEHRLVTAVYSPGKHPAFSDKSENVEKVMQRVLSTASKEEKIGEMYNLLVDIK